MDSLESDDDFDPRGDDTCVINNNTRNNTTAAPLCKHESSSVDRSSGYHDAGVNEAYLICAVSAPVLQPRDITVFSKEDCFGAEPFVKNADPFGMDDFGRLVPAQVGDPEATSNVNKFMDQRFNEMRDGFSRGISFEEDFNIETLDPLRP